MKITLRTSDQSISTELEKANLDGISVLITRMDSVDPSSLSTVIVTAASTVAAERFVDWICDHFKKKPDEKTVINGNKIDISAINITVIKKIVLGQHENKEDDD